MSEMAKLKNYILIAVFVLAVGHRSFAASIVYVDARAQNTSNGSCWENAYVYLQDALADANSMELPVEIRVAQGVYRPDQGSNHMPGDRTASFELVDRVCLKGAFWGLKKSWSKHICQRAVFITSKVQIFKKRIRFAGRCWLRHA